MRQALGILDTGPSQCGPLKGNPCKRLIQDMLSHTGLDTTRRRS